MVSRPCHLARSEVSRNRRGRGCFRETFGRRLWRGQETVPQRGCRMGPMGPMGLIGPMRPTTPQSQSHPAPPAMIRVVTPSRLHFGLLSLAAEGAAWPDRAGRAVLPARRFGGAGLMVQRPGVALRVEDAADWAAEGPLAGRA